MSALWNGVLVGIGLVIGVVLIFVVLPIAAVLVLQLVDWALDLPGRYRRWRRVVNGGVQR